MQKSTEIIVLVENSTFSAGLAGRHGLCLAIRRENTWLLFDTGPDATLLSNAQNLGVPLESIHSIILSHGHYDHAGGLNALSRITTPKALWMHPKAPQPKYRSDGSFIGMNIPPSYEVILHPTETPTEILPHVWLMPSIAITNPNDTHIDRLEKEGLHGREQDTFEDELFLVLEEAQSISIITGCSHRGITNIIETAMHNFNKPIDFIVGGFHLNHTTREARQVIYDSLISYPIKHIAVCHCTGLQAYAELLFLGKFSVDYASTGYRIHLPHQSKIP